MHGIYVIDAPGAAQLQPGDRLHPVAGHGGSLRLARGGFAVSVPQPAAAAIRAEMGVGHGLDAEIVLFGRQPKVRLAGPAVALAKAGPMLRSAEIVGLDAFVRSGGGRHLAGILAPHDPAACPPARLAVVPGRDGLECWWRADSIRSSLDAGHAGRRGADAHRALAARSGGLVGRLAGAGADLLHAEWRRMAGPLQSVFRDPSAAPSDREAAWRKLEALKSSLGHAAAKSAFPSMAEGGGLLHPDQPLPVELGGDVMEQAVAAAKAELAARFASA